MDSFATNGRQRIVYIDFDATTDTEAITDDNDVNPTSELSISYLQQCLSSDDEELDIELIDEFVFEDDPTQDTLIISDHSDESHVKQIEDYLKSDSFDSSDANKYTKEKKKSKERKSTIAKLIRENKDLKQELSEIKERLYLKVRQIHNLKSNRSRIRCFRCAEPAVHPFLCCWNGCYCSKKCRDIDWFVNEHFNCCLKSSMSRNSTPEPVIKQEDVRKRPKITGKRKLPSRRRR